MTKRDLWLQRPRGTKDYLAQQARLIRDIETRIREVFRLWGYREVITPTFEYIDVLRQGTGPDSDEMIFRFFDREGHILGLRSDATTPIARLAATRFHEENTVLRLSYLTNIFRYVEPGMGREREFHQAGVELIGSAEPRADSEVIHLAAEVFQSLGIDSYLIDLGEVSYALGVLAESGLSSREQRAVRAALVEKDFVRITEIISGTGITHGAREKIHRLTRLRGGAEVLEEARQLTANPVSLQALDRLSEVTALLPKEVTGQIRVDLGMLKDLEYYTGVIFEGYVADMGYTVCTGGRYDRLISSFGVDRPATGFGFGLERLLELVDSSDSTELRLNLNCSRELQQIGQVLAKALRRAGFVIAWSLDQNPADAEVSITIKGPNAFVVSAGRDVTTLPSVKAVLSYLDTLSGGSYESH